MSEGGLNRVERAFICLILILGGAFMFGGAVFFPNLIYDANMGIPLFWQQILFGTLGLLLLIIGIPLFWYLVIKDT